MAAIARHLYQSAFRKSRTKRFLFLQKRGRKKTRFGTGFADPVPAACDRTHGQETKGGRVREFTKAAISYGWSTTCFQMQQLVNLLSMDAETQDSSATTAFNAVAEATAAQLGPTMRATYRAGDAMQRGMVNVMFGMAGNWMPGCGDARGARRTAQLADAGAEGGFEPLRSASGHAGGRPPVRPSWRQPQRPNAGRGQEPAAMGAPDAGGAAVAGWGPMP
jgi:hypothetical protein